MTNSVPDYRIAVQCISLTTNGTLFRGNIHNATEAIARATEQAERPEVSLHETEAAILQLSEERTTRGFVRLENIVNNTFGSVDALLQGGQRIRRFALSIRLQKIFHLRTIDWLETVIAKLSSHG
jgi:replicative DNA helicase